MKKDLKKRTPALPADDEILPQYDFSQAARNPYVERYKTGSKVVVLEPRCGRSIP